MKVSKIFEKETWRSIGQRMKATTLFNRRSDIKPLPQILKSETPFPWKFRVTGVVKLQECTSDVVVVLECTTNTAACAYVVPKDHPILVMKEVWVEGGELKEVIHGAWSSGW